MMQAVPAAFTELPDDGWDHAVLHAPDVPLDAPIHVGLAVTVAPERRGEHLSSVLLRASMVRAAGKRLVIPVRPNRKADFPELSLQAYLDRTRADGLSIDPWLRTHQRLGAKVVGICATSMRLEASLAEWDAWCGPPGPSGVHPGLLNAVGPDGIYVEPNVWVEHVTGPGA